MSCVGFDRKDDKKLDDMYARKLLDPGWSGEVTDAEARHISEQLTQRPELRRVWEVAKFTRQRRKITTAIAKRLCAWWAQRSTEGVVPQNTNTVAKQGKQNIGETSGNRRQLPFPIG